MRSVYATFISYYVSDDSSFSVGAMHPYIPSLSHFSCLETGSTSSTISVTNTTPTPTVLKMTKHGAVEDVRVIDAKVSVRLSLFGDTLSNSSFALG